MDVVAIFSTLRRLDTKIGRMLGCLDATFDEKLHPIEQEELVRLGYKYGVHFVTGTAGTSLPTSFNELAPGRVRDGIDLLISELTIYPDDVIRESRINQIILCTQLRADGCARAGLAEMDRDTLLLDVETLCSNWHYARQALHHELFHAIDYNDDAGRYNDPRWAALNAAGFKYSSNQPYENSEFSKMPGFLSTYSTRAIYEDKAEVYSYLVVDYNWVQTRITKDEILTRKVTRMKELLRDFSPEFNDSFWNSRKGARSLF